MKIAIYARVSTKDGRQNTENQLAVLREWADRLGDPEPIEYVDEASGSKADRKALLNLLKFAHKYDVVLIWALDRLSREGIARLSGYLDLFKLKGVRVLSHQESWLDTSGPISELLVAIFGWVAKMERQRFSERIKAGLETARKRGKTLGRPMVEIDHQKIKDLYKEGRSIRAVAMHFEVSKSFVAKVVRGL